MNLLTLTYVLNYELAVNTKFHSRLCISSSPLHMTFKRIKLGQVSVRHKMFNDFDVYIYLDPDKIILFNISKFRILTSDSFVMIVIIVAALVFRDTVRLG